MPDKDKPLKDSLSPFHSIVASSAGALITSLFVTPLDVVKIRLQAQQKAFMQNKCFLYCNGLMEHICYCEPGSGGQLHPAFWYRRPGSFNGTMDAFVKIARHEGITSLWSGLPPTLLMAVPATVLYFTLYDFLKMQITNYVKPTEPTSLIPMAAGGLARTMSATVISPIELVRTKMQSQKLSYWQLSKILKETIHYQGYSSLWRGLGPTILRDVPFSSIYWGCYEFFKVKFDQEKPSFGFSFIAGATSGTVAAVVTLPFDVVKTHRQIELGEVELNYNKKFITTFSLMKEIYKSRGIPGLFSGIVPRVIKVAPACAIMISTYEIGKAFLRNPNKSKDEEIKSI